MFETAWVLLSDLLHGVSGLPDNIGLRELEEWNIPITSMICTGVGSGGDVSRLFYRIERGVYEKNTEILSSTLDKVLPRLHDEFELPWYTKIIPAWLIKKIIIKAASKSEDPRSYTNYLDDNKKAEHFDIFFKATTDELKRLKLPANSDTIIFGHTHHPYPSNQPYTTGRFPGLKFYNTGGWLKESRAEVFLIDNSRFESFTV
jgi:UDP-2,3-diacylglucosamine pyrophosphatase LpxH